MKEKIEFKKDINPEDFEEKKQLFTNFVNNHWGEIAKWANYYTEGDKNASEDLMQEALLRAFLYLPSFHFKKGRENESLEPWLKKIMLNTWKTKCRREKKVITSSRDDTFEVTLDESSKNWEDSLLNKDIPENLLKLLPKEFQEVLWLHLEEGLSNSEIAKKLNIPVGTVKSRIFRAKQILKDRFSNQK